MKRSLLIFSAFITPIFFSCSRDVVIVGSITGSGTVMIESRVCSNFSKVSASGSSEIYIVQGNTFKVEVKGYENLLSYYESKVENGTLKLGYRPNLSITNDNTEIFITMPALNGINLSGSGIIRTTGNFSGNNIFEVSLIGSGDISIAEGSTQEFKSYISGSGNIHAFDIIANNAETNTFGNGDTEVTATSKLKVKITGSGNVYYKRNPAISADISGSGKVLPG